MKDKKYIENLKKDFRNFLYRVWKHLSLPDPTPLQYEIADLLQHGGKRKIIEGYRGVGKSWITSVYVIWRLWRDPNGKFLVVSASKTRADAFSTFTKRLLRELPEVKHLQPSGKQRDSMVAFDVGSAKASHSPSVKSVGIFGQLTGSRATEIIADDVEVPNNSGTQGQRDKLLQRVLEFESIIIPKVGKITYLGTPQTEESLYNELPSRGYEDFEENYQLYIFPARYPSKEDLKKKYGTNGTTNIHESIAEKVIEDPEIAGDLTDPERYSPQELLTKEGIYGRSGFALQFMLDTSLSDAEKYPLKCSDLLVVDAMDPEEAPSKLLWTQSPRYERENIPTVGFQGDRFYRPMDFDKGHENPWRPYSGVVMAIDPSGRGADETTYALVAHTPSGYLWVLDVGGTKGGYDEESLKFLAEKARRYKADLCLIESNFGDGMFSKLFQPILKKFTDGGIEEVRHNKQKELRIIDTLEPAMNQHRLVFGINMILKDIKEEVKAHDRLHYSLLYQMTRLTRNRGALRHDDKIDVLAMGVAYWVNAMAIDEEESLEDFREDLLDEQLHSFMDTAQNTLGGNKDTLKAMDNRKAIYNSKDLRDIY